MSFMAAVIYVSDQLEILCGKLAQQIDRMDYPSADADTIFLPEVLITQTAGMESWLSTELTRRNGVFANFRFMKQDQLLEEAYAGLYGKKRYTTNIRPAIYELLGSESFITRFPDIAAYYSQDKQNNELRRMQLAGKTSDLFDQYQVYRPDMMSAWESAPDRRSYPPDGDQESSPGDPQDSDHEAWQRWLWNSVREKYPWFCPKHRMQARLLELLDEPQNWPKIRQMLPRLSLFGLSIFTTFHNRVLEKLARIIDVAYYLVLPSEHFFEKGNFSNPLSASLGRKYAEMAAMLPRECEVVPLWGQHSGETLLGKFRNTLRRDLVPQPGTLTEKDTGDGTLVINACYTPVREVEVFYNYLLSLMHAGAGLKPEDVLVLLPDVDTYAPYVKAVFGNGPYPIPFFIAGESQDQQDSIAGALMALMDFDALDGFTAEEVVSLLETKRICQKYGITDMQYLRDAIEALNIRFGLENRVEDDTRFVSWQYGFEKIMMGFAILTEQSIPSSQGSYTLFPWREAETSVAYDLLRLKAFLDDLTIYARTKTEHRSLADWKTFLLEEMLERSVAYSGQDDMELDHIYRRMEILERSYETTPLSFKVFRHLVADTLLTDTRSGMYITGNVNFLPVIPGRGIPKRVIAILGLNGNVFPRKDSSLGFDLLQKEPRLGDRSKKDNDKLIFLESLVASRDYLYISYIGRDIQDNTVLPPSIVLDELTDYLESLVPEESRELVRCGVSQVHPLHGFSSRYDGKDERLFTYLFSDLPEQSGGGKALQPDIAGDTIPGTVQLEDLAQFFTHPLEWYYQKILGIRYDEPKQPLPESEIFDLDNLQYWELKRFLVQTDPVGEQELVAAWTDKTMKEGNMPLARIKEMKVSEAQLEIGDLQASWQELTAGKTGKSCQVEITVGGIVVRGAVTNLFDNSLYDFTVSKDALKHQVKTRIRHLVLCACGFSGQAVFLDLHGKKFHIPAIAQHQAMEQLSRLTALFRQGCEKRLPITLKAANAFFLSGGDSGEPLNEALREIKKEAEGTRTTEPDPYVALAWEEGVFADDRHEALEQLMNEYAALILTPWET